MTEAHHSAQHGSRLARQFGHPTGTVGWLVGHAMALEHRALHRAVVDRLDLKPDDAALEIGFGPGTALRLAASRAAFVAGVEVSEVMRRQAERRNRAAIRSGRIELRMASATALPFPDSRFTVVFEVNSLHHWGDPERGLGEARRVLRDGGRILLALRDSGPGNLDGEIERVKTLITRAGFSAVAVERHRIGHGGAFVLARR
jgi:ubiquinone/menaquinone biosynthesis C-methylase UbiE